MIIFFWVFRSRVRCRTSAAICCLNLVLNLSGDYLVCRDFAKLFDLQRSPRAGTDPPSIPILFGASANTSMIRNPALRFCHLGNQDVQK
jgi:hypothetical protein